MTDRLTFWRYGGEKVEAVVTYSPREHWNTGSGLKAYDVTIDGVAVGRVEQSIESTDRHAGRIRIPGKGRVAWSWRRTDGTSNPAGLYASTRREAAARLAGFDRVMS